MAKALEGLTKKRMLTTYGSRLRARDDDKRRSKAMLSKKRLQMGRKKLELLR